MKNFILLFLISILISAGLTFFLFREPDRAPDPVREHYQQEFLTYAKTAEDLYAQYGPDGLALLRKHQMKGLRILTQFASLFQTLHRSLPAESAFDLCQAYGNTLAPLLDLFQPERIADMYTRFDRDGIGYLIENPERYFLLEQYGDRLIHLARQKGPIAFDLVKTYQPEFIELYYDNDLFLALSRFGLPGHLAIKKYRGMAITILRLFAEDERLARVLHMYGYQQIIPVLSYFYQKPPSKRLLSEGEEQPLPREGFAQADWALQQIYATGNTFLRQFRINEQGEVQPVPTVAMTNFLERLLIGDPVRQSAESEQDTPETPSTSSCDHLLAALRILGVLPTEAFISNQFHCLYLRPWLAEVRATQGIAGLLALENEADLVDRYGDDVVPFAARYGRKGLQILRQTDGEILRFASLYGDDMVQSALQFGPTVLTLVKKFGEQVLEALQETHGAIIPSLQHYETELVAVLAQPEGSDLLALTEVFGEEILPAAARYPGDFFRYLLQYGELAVNVFQKNGAEAKQLADQYGDEVILYLGLYGEACLNIIHAGRPGVLFLRILPPALVKSSGGSLFQRGLAGACVSLLLHHPKHFHAYLGSLHQILTVSPVSIQLTFWTVCVFLLLYILQLVYRLGQYFFRSDY